MSLPLLTMPLESDRDVVAARQRARQIARRLGFAPRTRRASPPRSRRSPATSSSTPAAASSSSCSTRPRPRRWPRCVRDDGPGIAAVEEALVGRGARRPAGLGLVGARRLMDRLDVESAPGPGHHGVDPQAPAGHHAAARRPRRCASCRRRSRASARTTWTPSCSSRTRSWRRRSTSCGDARTSCERMNRELEETNRGVVALYAELDEKAEHLRRADEVKTRFLSNMSHEFRTPLNSILALSRLLEERADGDLTSEQEKQVGFIVKAARSLSELVDDLLDLAKVEAGKIVVRPASFELAAVFGALRGMLRPLLTTDAVRLVFEEPAGRPHALRRRGQGRADPAQPPLERAQVHGARRGPAAGVPDRRRRARRDRGQRHRHRHRPRGPGPHLRGVRPGRARDAAPREGHRARPRAVAAAGRGAGRRPDRRERARRGVDVHAAPAGGAGRGAGATAAGAAPAGRDPPAADPGRRRRRDLALRRARPGGRAGHRLRGSQGRPRRPRSRRCGWRRPRWSSTS